MEEKYQKKPNIDMAIQASQKFEFYFIAIVFTI